MKLENLRLAIAVVVVVVAIIAGRQIAHDYERTDDAPYSLEPGPDYVCEAEDMMAYELLHDAFGHLKGEVICLHIDFVDDHPAAYTPGEK